MISEKMKRRLFFIKAIHTVIWAFYVFVIFYILYAAIYNKLDVLLWIAVGLVALEGLVLIVNHWKCPLTNWGYKYSDIHETGFDIFLPKWLAKHNKVIFGTIFILEMLLILYRLLKDI